MTLQRLENVIAGLLIASRWLMAPLYLGLIAALIVVGVEFFEELAHTVMGFASLDADSVILATLKLIDLVLVANLVLIMISAGIGTLGRVTSSVEHAGWAEFMGKIDFSGLKLKVVVSLVAFTRGLPVAVATVGFYVVYRYVEDYLLNPRVMKHTVKVTPGLTIIATLIGATLLGLIGALIAIPVAATVHLLLEEVAVPRQNQR